MDRFRTAANLATLANGAVGVGAILYTLAGNKLWGMLLIVCGIGFDGLDGLFSRRSRVPSGATGRILDSLADAVTFGVAPAALLFIHTDHASLWSPWLLACWGAGILLASLAFARLVYFTVRAYRLEHFLGAPTPQTALTIVVLGLLFDRPAFLGTAPLVLVVGATAAAILMVTPLAFPKVRRGARIRPWAIGTAIALFVALVPLQFVPAAGSPLYLLTEVATAVSAAGVVGYYVLGPLTLGLGGVSDR